MNILKIEKDPGDPSTDPLIKKFEEGWFVGIGGGVVRGNDRYDNVFHKNFTTVVTKNDEHLVLEHYVPATMEHASVYGFSKRKFKPSLKASTTSKKKKKKFKKTTRGAQGAKDEDDAFNFDTLSKGIAAGNAVFDTEKKSKVSKVTPSTDLNKAIDHGLSAPVAKSSSHIVNDVDVPTLLTKYLYQNDDDSHNNDDDKENDNDDDDMDVGSLVKKSYLVANALATATSTDHGLSVPVAKKSSHNHNDNDVPTLLTKSLCRNDDVSHTRSVIKLKRRNTQSGGIVFLMMILLSDLISFGNAIKSSHWNNNHQDDDDDLGEQLQRNADYYVRNELDRTIPEHMQQGLFEFDYGPTIPNPISSQVGSSIGNSFVTPPRQSSVVPIMPSNINANHTNSLMDHNDFDCVHDYYQDDDDDYYREQQDVHEAMDDSLMDVNQDEQHDIREAIEKSLSDVDRNRFMTAGAVSSRSAPDIGYDDDNYDNDEDDDDEHLYDEDYGNRTPRPLKTDRSSDDNKDSLDIIPPSTNGKPPPTPRTRTPRSTATVRDSPFKQTSISTLFPTTTKKKSSNRKTLCHNRKPPPTTSLRTPRSRSTASGRNSPFQQTSISTMFPPLTKKKSGDRKTLRPNSKPSTPAIIRTPRSRSTAVEENKLAVDNDECPCVAQCCCCFEPQKRQQSHGKRPRRSSDGNNSDDNNPSKPKPSIKKRRFKKSQSNKTPTNHHRKSPPTTHYHSDNFDVSKSPTETTSVRNKEDEYWNDDCDYMDDEDEFDRKSEDDDDYDDDFDWNDDDDEDDDDDDKDVIYDTINNPSSETYVDIDDQANHDQETNGPNEYMYGYTPDVRYNREDLLPCEVETEYEHVRFSRIEDHTPLLTHAGTPFEIQRHLHGGFLVSAHPFIHLPPPPGHIRDGDFHPDMNGGIIGAGRRIATVSATHTSSNAIVGCWDLPSVNIVSAVQHVYQNHRPALAASDNMVALIFTPINITDDNRIDDYRNFPRTTQWARSMHPVYSLVDVPASASDVVVFNISEGVPYQFRGALQSRWMVPLRTLEQKRESRKQYVANKMKDYNSAINKQESQQTEADQSAISWYKRQVDYFKRRYANRKKNYNSGIAKSESQRTEAEQAAFRWYNRKRETKKQYDANKRSNFDSGIAKNESDRTEAEQSAVGWYKHNRENRKQYVDNKMKDYNSAINKQESQRTEAEQSAVGWYKQRHETKERYHDKMKKDPNSAIYKKICETKKQYYDNKMKDYNSAINKQESQRTEVEQAAVDYVKHERETNNRWYVNKMKDYNSAINKQESDRTEAEQAAVGWYNRKRETQERYRDNMKKDPNSAINKKACENTKQYYANKYANKKKNYNSAMTKSESQRTEAEQAAVGVRKKEIDSFKRYRDNMKKNYNSAMTKTHSQRTEAEQAAVDRHDTIRRKDREKTTDYKSAMTKTKSQRTEADQVLIDKMDRAAYLRKQSAKNRNEKRKIAYDVAMTKTESERTKAENYAVYRKEYNRKRDNNKRKMYEDAKAIQHSERTESDQNIIENYECKVAECITPKYIGCYCSKHATPCKRCRKKRKLGNDGLCTGCRGCVS